MRALAAVAALAALFSIGCVRTCKHGTVLLAVTVPSGTDQIRVAVTVDGVAMDPQTLAFPATQTHGTVELDFSAYPAGRSLSINVTALSAGTIVGTGAAPGKTLSSG